MKSRPTLKSRLVAIVLTVVVATPVWSQTFSSSEVPQIISDHTTVTSTLTVPVGTGKVDGIQVQLTIDHTFGGDLRISLTSPQGNTVDLIYYPASGERGLSGDYLFEDSAGTRIVDLLMADINRRLEERRIVVSLTAEAAAWIGERGYDPVFGARPLKRFLQKQIENRLARGLIEGSIGDGSRVSFGLENGELTMAVGDG